MIEDKLTHNERLRLECIAQAVASHIGQAPTTEQLIKRAERIEQYVSKEKI